MSSTVTTATHSRPLSADAIEASRALASRERQEVATKKRGTKGKVSLGGSLTPTRYTDKAVRFTEDGFTKVRTVSVNDPDEIPNLTLDQKADLRRQWDREADATDATRDGAAMRAAMYGDTMDRRMQVADEHEDATPEQIARARSSVALGTLGGGGSYGVAAGVRFFEDPFTSLAARGSLDKDKAINDALFQAGIRYRNAVRTAGFDGAAKAMDLTKDIVDGGDPSSGLVNAERVAEAGKIVAEAQKTLHAVGRNLLPFIEAIVVRDQTVEQTWPILSRERARSAGYVFTVKVLAEGLTVLAHHWDMMPRDKHRAISACGADGVRFYERGRKKSA